MRSVSRERIAWCVLAAAFLVYAVGTLYLTRDTIPTYDSLDWLAQGADGFEPRSLLEPHNAHLIAVTRVMYATGVTLFGSGIVFAQVCLIVAMTVTATLVFIIAKRKLDPLLALVPALLMLFLGTTTVPIDPNVAVFAQSAAFGLGALLALQRGTRAFDALACLLLVAGVLAFSAGVPFVVGAGVMLLCRDDWLRRSWIVIVPGALYVAWYLWAGSEFGDDALHPFGSTSSVAGLLVLMNFTMDTVAAGLAAFSGLTYDFAGDTQTYIPAEFGRVLAIAAVVGLVVLWRRGSRSQLAAACAGVLIAFCVVGAYNGNAFRGPQSNRYAFLAAVLVVLVLIEMLPQMSWKRPVWLGAGVLLIVGLATNVGALRDAGATLRENSADMKTRLAVLELERDHVDPEDQADTDFRILGTKAGSYLALVDSNGSIAYSASELPGLDESRRELADQNLLRILGPVPGSYEGPRPEDCERVDPVAGVVTTELAPGGVVIYGGEESDVELRRFSDVPLGVGALPADGPALIAIPTDASPQPWVATFPSAKPVEICAAPAAEEQGA